MNRYAIPESYRNRIPSYTVAALERWVNEGGDLSGFYWHLLAGNVWDAARVADERNLAAFGYICAAIAESFPAKVFGSRENVAAWQRQKKEPAWTSAS